MALFLRRMGILFVATVTIIVASQSQTGTVDYVPNGGFEAISKPDALLGVYEWRYAKYALYWRQFHYWTIPNEVGTVPDWPIWKDRRWDPYDPMYAPVTCSSSDLFSQHLPNCVDNIPGSLWDVPDNWFGTELIRPGSFGQKYAGLYYRLNGIRAKTGGGFEWFEGNPETDYWREYLEVELLCELEEDAVYTVSFWASLAEISERTITLDARVTKHPYHAHHLDNCANVNDNDLNNNSAVRIPETDDDPPLLIVTSGAIPKNGAAPNNGWVLVQGNIIATGGERYLTIGNFNGASGDATTNEGVCPPHYNHIPLSHSRVYVYIDDVRLTRYESCECLATIQLVPIMPSPEQGECCYKVLLNNTGEFPCRTCTIDGVAGRRMDTQEQVFTWNSTLSHGPVVGDKVSAEIGFFCIDEFESTEDLYLMFDLKRADGETICHSTADIRGCLNACNCAEFEKSVELTPISVGENECCYRLKLDASLLGECPIFSIRYLLKNSSGTTEIAYYDETVSSSFSGYLPPFCPESPLNLVGEDHIEIEFIGYFGEVHCRVSATPKCLCDCKTAAAEVHFEKFEGPDDECCYNITLENISKCKVKFSSIDFRGSEVAGLDFAGSNGWIENSYGNLSTFTKLIGESLYPEEEYVIGTVCPSDCPLENLSGLQAGVTFTVNGQQCTRVSMLTTADDLCPAEVDCDDFHVSIIAYPIYNTSCCWYGVYAYYDVCPTAAQGLYVSIAGHPQTEVPTTQGTLIAAWSCQPVAATYNVILKRSDGTVLCTKTVSASPCYPAYTQIGPTDANEPEDQIGGVGDANQTIRAIDVVRGVQELDIELQLSKGPWVVFNTNAVIVASSLQTEHNSQSITDVVQTLPSGVYLAHSIDLSTGRTLVRKYHVLR